MKTLLEEDKDKFRVLVIIPRKCTELQMYASTATDY